MRICLLFSSVLFCLELTLRVSGRHRHGLLAECNKCAPGELLWKKCNRHRNAQCLPCPPGTYQPHHSYKQQCYLCSKCGDGLYVAHDCQPTRDTICDSCHTYKGPHNVDYQRRCQIGFVNSRKSIQLENWKSYQYDEVKNQQKFLLILSSGVVLTFLCCVTFFLLANRWCKNDRLMMGYAYHSINTEPTVL
ncbi:tumor necrosis factor receptor superfamily member 6B-like isoform X2 [Centruroides vittatus]|uniref:tumor necrosis factor receptor superfamily member 6B-like isoform X2 n=1 Tax=Centruroides vittatus TaxID=120091 RepID=UPI00350EE6F7